MKSFKVPSISRREFLGRATVGATGVALGWQRAVWAGSVASCSIVVFSKIYQELKLNYAQAAELTAEAGLDGIDCPVRPGGEVLPERVGEDLPLYAEALARQRMQIKLLTTAILDTDTPHAREVLVAAKKLGVRCYRLGAFKHDRSKPFEKQAAEIRAKFTDLAAMNRDLGMIGLFQNHTGSVGADLNESRMLMEGFNPRELGMAFDLGHALLAHGAGWKEHFEKLKPYLQVAYIKDAKIGGSWVPFGEGDFSSTGYFKMLEAMNYNAPFSLHIEFDWSENGKAKTRGSLLKALSHSARVLREWMKAA